MGCGPPSANQRNVLSSPDQLRSELFAFAVGSANDAKESKTKVTGRLVRPEGVAQMNKAEIARGAVAHTLQPHVQSSVQQQDDRSSGKDFAFQLSADCFLPLALVDGVVGEAQAPRDASARDCCVLFSGRLCGLLCSSKVSKQHVDSCTATASDSG